MRLSLQYYLKTFLSGFPIMILFCPNCRLASQETGIPKVDSLLQLAATTDNNILKIDYLNAASFSLLGIQTQKGIELAEQALALAEEMVAPKQMGDASNSLASYYVLSSDFDKALHHYLAAIEHYKQTNHEKGLADVYGNLGSLYYFKGDYSTALAYQFKALPVFEKLNNSNGIGNTLTGIGSIYMILKNYNEALYYDSLALKIYKESNDFAGLALIYGNLGNIYSDLGNNELGQQVYEKAIEIYDDLGIKDGLGRTLSNLATIIIGKKDFAKAFEILKKARQVCEEIGNNAGLLLILGNMGMCHYKSYLYYNRQDSILSILPGTKAEHLENAINLLSKTISIAENTGELEPLKYFTQVLTELYDQSGQPLKAYPVYKKYVAVKDSIHNLESQKQIQQLITERELLLKNKQIELDKLAVEKKRNERVYFIIGLILLTLSLLFIYRNFINQKKSNVILEKLNIQIVHTNKELETKNDSLIQTLETLKQTQDQLIRTEKIKENAILRSKISQDIHDDISSGLTKISWLAETLKAKIPQASDTNLIDKINAYSREAVVKLGEIIWSTNPDRDNLPSLLAYMRSFLNKYFEDSPIQCHIDFPDPVPDLQLNPELRRNIFLVFKEAVHNAFKYSKARDLEVRFTCENNTFQLKLNDNGIGFEKGSQQGSGNGMRNMEKRMQAIGGAVVINSTPGSGTQLLFSGPLFV